RGCRIEFAAEGNDAAECGGWVGAVGLVVRVRQGSANRDATGVGMFDDDTGRRTESLDAFESRIGVGNIVERQRLALQLGSAADRAGDSAICRVRIPLNVKRGLLVRIFAVAQ